MKKGLKLCCGALAFAMAAGLLAGCGDPLREGKTVVTFWGWADDEEAEIVSSQIKWYNENNTDNIYVDYVPRPGDYVAAINSTLGLDNVDGPDVFYASDEDFKRWVKRGFMADLQDYVDAAEIDLSSMWDSAVYRYRYDPETNTNNPDDHLYALPKDISPTGLFYNKSVFENHGVKVISVDEADLDEFNAGTKADKTGKTKADYGIPEDFEVPAQGFYRQHPYRGGQWRKPQYADGKVTELMIFNNRIAMSWDEVEDLSMLFTKEDAYNAANLGKSDPTWGYLTHWWFAYGWSVGGDCAVDTTGNGDWEFTLGDETPHYLVYNEDGNYAVGDDYKALFVTKGEGDKLLRSDGTEYTLQAGQTLSGAMPSQRDAFERFVALTVPTGKGGLGISPRPQDVGTTERLSFFTTGRVAMIVEQNYRINSMRHAIGDRFEWDVAPLPIYKEYDLMTGEVSLEGVPAGHSGSTGFCIWSKSKVKDDAFKVIEYLTGETAQRMMANGGYNICIQRDLAQTEYVQANVADGKAPQNISVFVEYGDIQRPGDWWYMPDKTWIEVWAPTLNSDVKNGDRSIDAFFSEYTSLANDALKAYKG